MSDEKKRDPFGVNLGIALAAVGIMLLAIGWELAAAIVVSIGIIGLAVEFSRPKS